MDAATAAAMADTMIRRIPPMKFWLPRNEFGPPPNPTRSLEGGCRFSTGARTNEDTMVRSIAGDAGVRHVSVVVLRRFQRLESRRGSLGPLPGVCGS